MINKKIIGSICRCAKALRQTGKRNFAVAVLAHTVTLAAATEPFIITLPATTTATDVQHALDSLPATGGEVVLPAAKIVVRQPIVLSRAGQTLRGAGDATILFLADNANCPVIVMGQPVNHPKPIRHLRVSGLLIDGNRLHQQRERWQTNGECSQIRNNGITAQNISDSTVEHITTMRCRSGGVVTTLFTRDFTVSDLNSFDNQFDGLACFLTYNCHFTDLNLHDNLGAGISLDGNFHHNLIEHAVLDGNDLGIFMRWSHDNEFRDISIQSSLHYGVFMAQNPDSTIKSPTDCSNNSFTQLVAGSCGGPAFRVNDATCTNNLVTGAKFSGNLQAELSLAMPGLLLVK
jgi:hypothetical protein